MYMCIYVYIYIYIYIYVVKGDRGAAAHAEGSACVPPPGLCAGVPRGLD